MFEVTAEGRAAMAELAKGQRGKADIVDMRDGGLQPGPGTPMQPVAMDAGDYQRGPLTEGHASYGANYGPPNTSPMAPNDRGRVISEAHKAHNAGFTAANGELAATLEKAGMRRRES